MSATRERFDVLFDNIVTRLEAYATAQAGINPALGFRVIPDNARVIGELSGAAAVIPRLDRVDFQTDQSAVGQEWQIEASYAVDCIVKIGSSGAKKAGEEAGARLRYLITQVIRALWNRDDWELGITPRGQISRGTPNIQNLMNELAQTEKAIMGATVEMPVSMMWEILGADGDPLESIHVDANRWSALYEYGGH